MRTRPLRWILPLLLVAAVVAGGAMAATTARHGSARTVKLAKSASFGRVLVAANGRALYRYTPDSKGKSVCKGQCLAYWPPLLVAAKAKPTAGPGVKAKLLGTIRAAHGKRQVTYRGFPLYYYAGDSKAGQLKGQGVQGVWYLVSPGGALVKKAAAKTTSQPTPPPPTTTTSSGGGDAWG